jgi:hypothetical protein
MLHNNEKEVAASDGAPDFCFLQLSFVNLNRASGAAPQQGSTLPQQRVGAPDGAPDCFLFLLLLLFFYNHYYCLL